MSTRSFKRSRTHVDGRCTSATQGNQLGRDICPNGHPVIFDQIRVSISGLRIWQKKRGHCTRTILSALCACELEVTVPVDGVTTENDLMVACSALNDLHPQQHALPAPVAPAPVAPAPVPPAPVAPAPVAPVLVALSPVDSADDFEALLNSDFLGDSNFDFSVALEDDFETLLAQVTPPVPELDHVPCPLEGCGIGDCYHCYGVLGLV